jgi:hypothetical protein
VAMSLQTFTLRSAIGIGNTMANKNHSNAADAHTVSQKLILNREWRLELDPRGRGKFPLGEGPKVFSPPVPVPPPRELIL